MVYYVYPNDNCERLVKALVETGLYGTTESEVADALFMVGLRGALEKRFVSMDRGFPETEFDEVQEAAPSLLGDNPACKVCEDGFNIPTGKIFGDHCVVCGR